MSNEGKKIYEVECNRTNISPKQFWNYCCRVFKAKTGRDFSWIDDFDAWANPYMLCNDRWDHVDWDEPLLEICTIMPFNYHQFLAKTYNFIMEYDDGHGYFYVVEFER